MDEGKAAVLMVRALLEGMIKGWGTHERSRPGDPCTREGHLRGGNASALLQKGRGCGDRQCDQGARMSFRESLSHGHVDRTVSA
jgi:hypothetical protein